jgi:8-oxo-dGTP diphosphatase
MSLNKTISQPDNNHSDSNPVGRFMVAVGALIIHEKTKKMLITQRAGNLDWHPNEWEITYGRIDQHEDPEVGLKREVAEEIGLTDLTIQSVLRVWHMYRGPKSVENDLIGITFVCLTSSTEALLSNEHQDYRWVTPQGALNLISVPGIRTDIETYISQGQGR